MDFLAVDYVVFAVLLVSAALSLMRGFTKEVLSIAGLVISVYAAIYFGPLLKPSLASYIDISWVVNIGSMLLVFLVTLMICSFAFGALAKVVKATPIGVLDRTLGVVFGGLRGALIACLGYFVFVLMIPEPDHPEWMSQAKTRPLLQTGTKLMVSVMPMDRLPLNISNIGSFLNDNPAANKALQNFGENLLNSDENSPPESQNEIQDSGTDTGYKQTERNSMERLIRNTEGLE